MNQAPRLDRLEDIERAVWQQLDRCVTDEQHPWRIGVLATSHAGRADARNVVLREVEQRTLLIYTDARSPKARQIEVEPQGVLVLWSERLGWQLRLRVHLTLQTEGLLVSSRWARLKMTPAAHDYLSPLPPGSALDAPAPRPQRESRDHFAVIAAEIVAIDWLELDARGHRRAQFDGQGRRWVTP